jgi:DNA-binding transcriptional LysR family regulator
MDEEDFKPREIEVFAAIMTHGTTTRAAEALELTQPAVSKTLARFQQKAGFEVFKKHRQRLVPTQEAHMLYAEVQRTYESARQISRTARDIRGLRNGRLNICSLCRWPSTFAPRRPSSNGQAEARSTLALPQPR